MKMAEFKELPIEDALTMLNEYMLSIKDVPGRLEDNFKDGPFGFGYSSLTKYFRTIGVKLDPYTYQFSSVNDVKPRQVVVKQKPVKKEQLVVKSKQELTIEEIMFVKELFVNKHSIVKESQELVNSKQEPVKPSLLVVPVMSGAKKQTGISVYADVWERWGDFKKEYSMYSGTDLLTLAIEEFMDKYQEKDSN